MKSFTCSLLGCNKIKMIETTTKILDKLNIFGDDLAHPKICYGDLIYALLTHRSVSSITSLGVSERTLERLLPKAFPTISRDPKPWQYKLLNLLESFKSK